METFRKKKKELLDKYPALAKIQTQDTSIMMDINAYANGMRSEAECINKILERLDNGISQQKI